MVTFTCNGCGTSLKKNKVEGHLNSCRKVGSFSCIDCNKDFNDVDYKTHTKCITEDQKYGGAEYQAKPNSNKGEKKQNAWVENVQEFVRTSNLDRSLRELLEKIVDYPNIPRKQIKFENFIKNSIRVKNPALIKKAWDICSTANKKEQDEKKEVEEKKESNVQLESDDTQNDENEIGTSNKMLKKEKKRKHAESISVEMEDTEEKLSKKKESKRKEQEDQANGGLIADEAAQNGDEQLTRKQKKKLRQKQDQEKMDTSEALEDKMEIESEKGRFSWGDVIETVLKSSDDHEISLKKLKKKVLNEYKSYPQNKAESDEEIGAKFMKKLSRSHKFRVLKDRVKLIVDENEN